MWRAYPGSGILNCLKEFRAKMSTEDMKTKGWMVLEDGSSLPLLMCNF